METALEYCLLVSMDSLDKERDGKGDLISNINVLLGTRIEFLLLAEPDLWNSSVYAELFFLFGDWAPFNNCPLAGSTGKAIDSHAPTNTAADFRNVKEGLLCPDLLQRRLKF